MPCFFLSKRNTPNYINEKCKLISKLSFLRSLQRKGYCAAVNSAKWWSVISSQCLDCWCRSPDHKQWASTPRWVGMAFHRALLQSICVSHCRDCRTKFLGRLFFVKTSLTSWRDGKEKKMLMRRLRRFMPRCQRYRANRENAWKSSEVMLISELENGLHRYI